MANQKKHLNKVTKPFKLNCDKLASRLVTILKFEDEENNDEVCDDMEKKCLYHNMMLKDWKNTFQMTNQELTDPTHA